VGFRHFDCAERYRNEQAVGDAMREMFKAGAVQREDVFVTTKLWNNNHRPERVKPAFEASCQRLQLDYVDCYSCTFAKLMSDKPIDLHWPSSTRLSKDRHVSSNVTPGSSITRP
jgi:diketogulonate reductase-like aldo/keto reductase